MTSNAAPILESEQERRLRRAAWPVRQFGLGHEPTDDLSASTSAEERIDMMWTLALEAFSIGSGAGEAPPRSGWPVRRRALGDPAVE
jgi:hypothetical protein